MSKRIGVYAGTFDPVHVGHVAFAVEAVRACRLDEVVFLPEREPWRKQGVTDIAHRFALLEHAVSDAPGLRVMDLGFRRFTVRQALPELVRLFGGSELLLLMGSDVARSLHAWDNVGELLSATSLAVGLRREDTAQDIKVVMERLAQSYGPVAHHIVSVLHPDTASTAARRGDHAVLHPEVSAYIKRYGLYGTNA